VLTGVGYEVFIKRDRDPIMFEWIAKLFSPQWFKGTKFWVESERAEDIGPDSKSRTKHYTRNFHKACQYAKSLSAKPHNPDHPTLYKVMDEYGRVLAQWSGRVKRD
jgi:hypothetical protein